MFDREVKIEINFYGFKFIYKILPLFLLLYQIHPYIKYYVISIRTRAKHKSELCIIHLI